MKHAVKQGITQVCVRLEKGVILLFLLRKRGNKVGW